MIVRFTGDPSEIDGGASQSLEMFGVVFPRGEAVDVSALSADLQAKIANNTHFSQETKRKRGRPRKEE